MHAVGLADEVEVVDARRIARPRASTRARGSRSASAEARAGAACCTGRRSRDPTAFSGSVPGTLRPYRIVASIPSGIPSAQAVVDHRGDEAALLGRDGLLLDHRRDDEDVVRREVLRPRVAEVDLAPLPAEVHELVADEPAPTVVSFVNSYVAGKRKPSIDAQLPSPCGTAAAAPRLRSPAGIRSRVSRGVTPRLSIAISRTASTRSAISRRVNPSGKMTRSRAERRRRLDRRTSASSPWQADRPATPRAARRTRAPSATPSASSASVVWALFHAR